MTRRNLIEKAINLCGGTQKALGDAIGLTQPGVHWLLNGEGQISPSTALKIERATKGEVTAHQLRPDIFGASA